MFTAAAGEETRGRAVLRRSATREVPNHAPEVPPRHRNVLLLWKGLGMYVCVDKKYCTS